MLIPGVHVETILNPTRYTYAQIELACLVASFMGRGKFVLLEMPKR
jgi:hypothetical protein